MTEMYEFHGEYECKLDSKGRMKLPKGLLRQLGDSRMLQLFINRGFENHLSLYPQVVWSKKMKEIGRNLNLYNSTHRQVIRYWTRGASLIQVDAADRILVPKNLIEYADIDKEVVIVAYLEEIEIWSLEKYKEEIIKQEPVNFQGIVGSVLGGEDPLPGVSSDNE